HVLAGRMRNVAVEPKNGAGPAFRCAQAMLIHNRRKLGRVRQIILEPVGGRRLPPVASWGSLYHSKGVCARYEDERTVELRHIVEEDCRAHSLWSRHLILKTPEREVLVPSPCSTTERRLAVDLELVHVYVVIKDRCGDVHQPRVP